MYRFRTLLPGVLLLPALSAPAQVHVVATSPTLQDITRQIGKDLVTVDVIMRGPENAHNVIPKPSFLMKVRRADLFVHKGLDGEPWAPQLLKGARQRHLQYGGEGNLDVHAGIRLMEVPAPGTLSRAQGDIHVFGNTHYALDPLNGVIIARNIAAGLRREDPDHAAEYQANYEAYATRLRELSERLIKALEPYRGTPVVTYHRTWPYFLRRMGLVKVGEVEPKPGIAPGPRSLADCVANMKSTGTKIVIVETYNSKDNADSVAQRVDGVAVVLAQEVNALPGVDTYERLFERNVELLLKAFNDANVQRHD